MSDLFHEDVPDEFIDRVFAVMAMAHWHTFQVLTKRAVRMRDYLASRSKNVKYWEKPAQELDYPFIRLLQFPFQNIWLGVSVEDQKRADERIPPLLETVAAVRFVSAEPLLGPINFDSTHESDPCSSNFLSGIEGERIYDGKKCALDWVIVGGESGPGARPMDPEWARFIREGTGSYPLECTSNGSESNLEGGLVRGGRSAQHPLKNQVPSPPCNLCLDKPCSVLCPRVFVRNVNVVVKWST